MYLYRVEIKERGTILKVVGARARNAIDAIDKIARAYPIGPYEFTARRVMVN